MKSDIKKSIQYNAVLTLIYGMLFIEFIYSTEEQDDCSGKALLFLSLMMYSFLILAIIYFAEMSYYILISCGCAREASFYKAAAYFSIVNKITMLAQYIIIILGTVWYFVDDNDCEVSWM